MPSSRSSNLINPSQQLIKKPSKLINRPPWRNMSGGHSKSQEGAPTRPFMLLWNEFKVCGKIIVQNCPFQFWYSKSALTCSSNLSRRFPFCLLQHYKGPIAQTKNLNELAKGFRYQKQQKKFHHVVIHRVCINSDFIFHFSSTVVQQVLEYCKLKLSNLDSQCDIQQHGYNMLLQYYNQVLSRNSKVFGYLYDSNFCGPAVLILMSAI